MQRAVVHAWLPFQYQQKDHTAERLRAALLPAWKLLCHPTQHLQLHSDQLLHCSNSPHSITAKALLLKSQIHRFWAFNWLAKSLQVYILLLKIPDFGKGKMRAHTWLTPYSTSG